MTKSRHLLFLMLLLMFATSAEADIYKCVDDVGHTTYTNDKPNNVSKGCTLMSRDLPVSSVPMPLPANNAHKSNNSTSSSSPAGFPKVDENTQKSRDGDRRKILETELANEMKLLDAAKEELAQQEGQRLGGEKNYQKYLDRVERYKDSVQLHEHNIEAIRKEISNLK